MIKELAQLAFIMEELVHGEYCKQHNTKVYQELELARELVLSTLRELGVDTEGDDISIINEGR